ncbi:lea domain protein [Zalerion maritima]|uniref:Lea domain protein n=1 Tax=Zalerion maritima TaxID=339359 RepID=A0AAD5RWJ9_9PEZI|nr:lea domain protein [Zalerion maritima]
MSHRILTAAPRQLATASRVAAVSTTRTFTTSFAAQKSATEAVTDTLKAADRKVSDKIVSGINAGETLSQKVKEGVSDISSGKIKGEAERLREEAAGKASELKGDTAEKTGEAKGTASEIAGEAKGKAKEVAGEAKGKVKEMTS